MNVFNLKFCNKAFFFVSDKVLDGERTAKKPKVPVPNTDPKKFTENGQKTDWGQMKEETKKRKDKINT